MSCDRYYDCYVISENQSFNALEKLLWSGCKLVYLSSSITHAHGLPPYKKCPEFRNTGFVQVFKKAHFKL